MEANFIRPTLEEALEIAPYLREDDVAECRRFGHTAEQAVRSSYEQSDYVWLAYVDGKPACLIGVGRTCILGNIGTPWFLTTPVMETAAAKKELIRLSPTFVSDFMLHYDALYNYVDAKYIKALRWLKWLGFEIGKKEVSPVTGEEFHEIKMERGASWAS